MEACKRKSGEHDGERNELVFRVSLEPQVQEDQEVPNPEDGDHPGCTDLVSTSHSNVTEVRCICNSAV